MYCVLKKFEKFYKYFKNKKRNTIYAPPKTPSIFQKGEV